MGLGLPGSDAVGLPTEPSPSWTVSTPASFAFHIGSLAQGAEVCREALGCCYFVPLTPSVAAHAHSISPVVIQTNLPCHLVRLQDT